MLYPISAGHGSGPGVEQAVCECHVTHPAPAPLLSSLALAPLWQYSRGVLSLPLSLSVFFFSSFDPFINVPPIVKNKMEIHSWAIAADFLQSGDQ